MTARRLIVVDDEVDLGKLVCAAAQRLGFETYACASGRQLKDVYDVLKPTDIVLDVVMPDEDGIEILNWLALQPHKSRVVLTSGYNPHYARTAQIVGGAKGVDVAGFLPKPITLKDLEAALGVAAPVPAPVAGEGGS